MNWPFLLAAAAAAATQRGSQTKEGEFIGAITVMGPPHSMEESKGGALSPVPSWIKVPP